jgi:TrmH family RNA methyltransferase
VPFFIEQIPLTLFIPSITTAMPDAITSVHNPRIRNILSLQSKSRERRQQNLIIIEGYREISRALASGVKLMELYYCSDFENETQVENLNKISGDASFVEINKAIFEKLAYREGSDGLIALAQPGKLALDELNFLKPPLIIILEAVEKPGNLGAIMRTADAASADAVIVCNPLTDIYNPNVIRSSVGCVFTVPVIAADAIEVRQWLNRNHIHSYAAALTDNAVNYVTVDYSEASAIVLGTEATGLSESWLQFCDRQIIIPMNGIADSLNVSTSAAIIVFEAIRQRETSWK